VTTNGARATVIVRTKNSARTLRETLQSLRDQTVECEIVVVDSGSTDSTLDIARDLSDRVVLLPEVEFSYGRALNRGAEVASAQVHVALSSHCVPRHRNFLAYMLTLYERDDVAGVSGKSHGPYGEPLVRPYFQSETSTSVNPYWGFSNHASSWRSAIWERHRFDERLEAGEDLEWARRVLSDGTLLVLDPRVAVATRRRQKQGVRPTFARARREARALATYLDMPPRTLADVVKQWWQRVPPDPDYPAMFYRANYWAMAEIAGRYVGRLEGRRGSRST
jgi:rhamnosyltransferase